MTHITYDSFTGEITSVKESLVPNITVYHNGCFNGALSNPQGFDFDGCLQILRLNGVDVSSPNYRKIWEVFNKIHNETEPISIRTEESRPHPYEKHIDQEGNRRVQLAA